MLKNSSSPFILISSLQRSTTLLALFLSFLKIACLHVSFTAYENFYKLSKMHCLLVLFSTFSPSEVSDNRNPTIKHISTYTLITSWSIICDNDCTVIFDKHNITIEQAYNNFIQDLPWESRGGLQQDNCQFGDMMKDEKRKSQFKYYLVSLWVTMQYPYPWATST